MALLTFILAPVALFAWLSAATYVPGKAFDRFITIWLENQDFFKSTMNPDLKNLTEQGILLTSFYALTHPSQPNYIASVGGDYFGLNNDSDVEIPSNVSTVVDLFDTQGIAWKEYLEGIPSPGFEGTGANAPGGKLEYVRKHNPLISFQSVSKNSTRLSNIQSFDDFKSDLASQSLPQWAHMSPSMTDDGHDTSLAYATNWSRTFLTPLLQNPYFMNNTLILLTYDETETYSQPNKIASILLGGVISSDLANTTDDTFYTHYSVLSTLENNWGLPNLGRYDAGSNVFSPVANKTQYQNQKVDTSKLLLNQSYPGFLNTKNYLLIPPPNLSLIGAGGKGVLSSINDTWFSAATDHLQTPYNGTAQAYDGFKSLPTYVTEPRPTTTKKSGAEQVSPAVAALVIVMCAAFVLL